jgi:hypothetical protein|tara:strand:+ start:115 stop:390 length:276 start_codon:yes stop_codon:yes gene_type:complete
MGCGTSSASRVVSETSVVNPGGLSAALSIEEADKTLVTNHKPELDFQISERISWRKGDLIGTGANGRVYLGLEEDTGAIIAVKEILFTKNE